MNKIEFIRELKNALEGKLSNADIKEVTSDYGDIFDNGVTSGKSESDVAAEIGSPARIARTILEDGVNAGSYGAFYSSSSKAQREYTDFQRNINEKTSRIFDKVITPDRNVQVNDLAPMSSRLGAYIIDCILLGILSIGLVLIVLAPIFFFNHTSVSEYSTNNVQIEQNDALIVQDEAVMVKYEDLGVVREVPNYNGKTHIAREITYFPNTIVSAFAFGNVILLLLVFSGFNFFTAILLWATNGYTPGKWLLRMRVVKVNGQKLRFVDAFLRDVVIKCIANSLLSGFLNLGSFIWGCVTDDHKTVQDLVAQTRVVNAQRKKQVSNPLES